MAYVPSYNIGDIGLKFNLKKGVKKLGKLAKKVALPVSTAVVTGGASLPAISVATAKQAAATAAKKSLTKATSGKKPSQIPVKTQMVASQQNIPPVSDDKIFGLDKKVVIFGGAGLGALLLIVLVAKK